MERYLIATVFLFAVALGSEEASAAHRSVPLTDVAVIQDGEGHARILVRHAPLGETRGLAISEAFIKFHVGGAVAARALEVHAYPITSAWSRDRVDWVDGWDTPGGDVDRGYLGRRKIDLSRGPQEVSVNVLMMVTDSVSADLESHGFLFTVPPERGAGFSAEDLARLGLAEGTLELTYRQVGPGPRRE